MVLWLKLNGIELNGDMDGKIKQKGKNFRHRRIGGGGRLGGGL